MKMMEVQQVAKRTGFFFFIQSKGLLYVQVQKYFYFVPLNPTKLSHPDSRRLACEGGKWDKILQSCFPTQTKKTCLPNSY